MRENFDQQLKKLNEELEQMGILCEKSVEEAMNALLNGNAESRLKASLLEEEIDHKERAIETMCVKLLLKQQPVAKDLRTVSAALKMISDMERIGDQASDIADIAKFLGTSEITHRVHLQQMAEAAMEMLNHSIDAFVRKDLTLAQEVMKADDKVDELLDQIKSELVQIIAESPQKGELLLDILMVAKYFERIGDHVVNIAEWVEYSVTGSKRSN